MLFRLLMMERGCVNILFSDTRGPPVKTFESFSQNIAPLSLELCVTGPLQGLSLRSRFAFRTDFLMGAAESKSVPPHGTPITRLLSSPGIFGVHVRPPHVR